ncbi:citrate lyase acyl carrier protein [Photobacterium toruni]|uniref:Citrate lyase acyl carrier protein n=1 Tax=Photobacterium toruni TaxID=1935446 RepID=A0ABU6LCU7_9GAMM|nr:citrate lyase acyl carrier protein [Photobacterium toruni]
MKICQSAIAGTFESSDVFIEIEPSEQFQLTVTSTATQFRDAVEAQVRCVLDKLNINNGIWRVTDSGALDCIIAARVQVAALRGAKQISLHWEEML